MVLQNYFTNITKIPAGIKLLKRILLRPHTPDFFSLSLSLSQEKKSGRSRLSLAPDSHSALIFVVPPGITSLRSVIPAIGFFLGNTTSKENHYHDFCIKVSPKSESKLSIPGSLKCKNRLLPVFFSCGATWN